MKCVIAGSRDITDYNLLLLAIEISRSSWLFSEIVSGKAPGVDTLGERYAEENEISLKEFPADWNRYGRAAGHLRNQQMAKYADFAIILWDGKSAGTKSMIKYMSDEKKPAFVYRMDGKYAWIGLEYAWWLDE